MDKGLLADWILRLTQDADEAHLESNDDFTEGRKLAFYEVLASLQNILKIHYPDEINDYGLNFDMDKRFLSQTVSK